MWLDIILLLVGGLGIWLGSEGMVRGAVKVAKHFGISAMVIGLTVVAFGTSAPEWVVSTVASVQGHNEIALGNVIGSNIINIALVLGISALIAPITVSRKVLYRDLPVVLVITLLVVGLAFHGNVLGPVDGIILLLCLVGYSIYSYFFAKQEQERITMSQNWEQPTLKKYHVVFLIGGILILAGGAEAMIRGAVGLAEAFGMSKRLIGMTIIAFGTSVPELAASVVAAKRGESDLALGNAVGSNIFNATLILGTASLISPIPCKFTWMSPDIFFFVATVVILFPMMRIRYRIERISGITLLAVYALAILFLFA
jgi:cation:H+ antiporter